MEVLIVLNEDVVDADLKLFCSCFSLGTLVIRPAGNDNKGAMKLRVDFKHKHTGDFILIICKLFIFGL